MLQLKGIKKDYVTGDTKVHALKRIDLSFRENEFVSILGQSGCGKTTMLNIIGGLDKYTDGDLIIKGKSTKDFKDRDWDAYRNHSVGFVFQSYNLIPHLSIIKNVEMALTLSGVKAKERKARAVAVLERVGLGNQLHKRPNQLSGGQMQRVAIARAIINNPEILLADEPTGALDSETSVQIMELIKEISKERLVIMVTHNPELAKEYSSRIIEVKDGEVLTDSNPYVAKDVKVEESTDINLADKEEQEKPTTRKKKEKRAKTSMSFWTALSLSFKNLISKKGRTIMTAFAGSIGIIGIALVLALSNGFQIYIDKMQADTLSSYPLTIAEDSLDIASMLTVMEEEVENEKYPSAKKIIVNEVMTKLMQAMTKKSNITEDYVNNVIKTMNKDWYYDIIYTTGYDITHTMYIEKDGIYTSVASSTGNSSSGMMSMFATSPFQMMMDNHDFIATQYDLIDGRYPENKNELLLVVDEYNQLSDTTLMSLGIRGYGDTSKEYTFDTIKGYNYKLLTNQDNYVFDGTKYSTIPTSSVGEKAGVECQVVGVIRPNSTTQAGVFSNGIAYTRDLYQYMLDNSADADIIDFMIANPTTNPMTGEVYADTTTVNGVEMSSTHTADMRTLGGMTSVNSIAIYAKDFDSKNEIKTYLDNYNKTATEDNKVYYSDVMEVMASTLSTMVNSVSYVLIAFTGVSLIVSSIMIGIITYVSVIERTKEIGVLRSLGARKKDISRVFNAETFMIGLTAGLLGVGVAYLLTLPINMLLSALLPEIGNLANLNIGSAVILIVISVLLTLISGLIPSRVASKKDPVVALRTE